MEKLTFREQIELIEAEKRLGFVVENLVERTRQSNKCPGCWLQRANCACALWQSVSCRTKVVVHIHHCEWGVCSNTGICIHRTLKESLFLLRGLPNDDEKMEQIWKDPAYMPCILWPGEDAMSVAEVRRHLPAEKQLLLIVPDGTFSSARRMMKKYPQNCVKVALSSESVLEGKRNSFLYPVRKYGGSEADTGRVSTLEAVAAFMREIEEEAVVAETLIGNMKLQMDRALKQKSRAMIYGTSMPN